MPVRQRALEIVDPGERYDASEREGIGAADGAALGLVPAAGGPKCQVAARRVSDHDDAAEIERMDLRERAQEVRGHPDIGEGTGIAAAAVAEPAELDVPTGDAGFGKRLGKTADLIGRPVAVPAAGATQSQGLIEQGRSIAGKHVEGD